MLIVLLGSDSLFMYLFSCLLGSLLRYAFGSRAYTLTILGVLDWQNRQNLEGGISGYEGFAQYGGPTVHGGAGISTYIRTSGGANTRQCVLLVHGSADLHYVINSGGGPKR